MAVRSSRGKSSTKNRKRKSSSKQKPNTKMHCGAVFRKFREDEPCVLSNEVVKRVKANARADRICGGGESKASSNPVKLTENERRQAKIRSAEKSKRRRAFKWRCLLVRADLQILFLQGELEKISKQGHQTPFLQSSELRFPFWCQEARVTKQKKRRKSPRRNVKEGGRAAANRKSARLSKLRKKVRFLLRLFVRETKLQRLKDRLAAATSMFASSSAPSSSSTVLLASSFSSPSYVQPVAVVAARAMPPKKRMQNDGYVISGMPVVLGQTAEAAASASPTAFSDLTPLPVSHLPSNIGKAIDVFEDLGLFFPNTFPDHVLMPGVCRGNSQPPQNSFLFASGASGDSDMNYFLDDLGQLPSSA